MYEQSSPLPTSAILEIPTDVFSEATPFVAFYICFQNTTSSCVPLERGRFGDISGFPINSHPESSDLSDFAQHHRKSIL